jgi:hypothetical protein
MGKIGEQATVIALAIVGLAVVAVIVSNRANTANVIGAFGQAFSNSLGAALRPVVSGSAL